MSQEKDSAEELGAKLDRCLTDGVIKLGGGTFLGVVSSLLFLGRRRWPIIAGAGMGIGVAYANCEYEINPKPPRKKRDRLCMTDPCKV